MTTNPSPAPAAPIIEAKERSSIAAKAPPAAGFACKVHGDTYHTGDCDLATLRAKLAEVERERDRFSNALDIVEEHHQEHHAKEVALKDQLAAAQAQLAAVRDYAAKLRELARIAGCSKSVVADDLESILTPTQAERPKGE